MATTATTEAPDKDRPEIIEILRAYHAAMVDARTEDLEKLLGERFSMVHITGYKQPKQEWFGVIRSGQFDYHRIDIDEKALAVDLTGSSAVVTGRGIFDATINGARNDWRLQFTLRCEKRGDRWVIGHARYTTY